MPSEKKSTCGTNAAASRAAAGTSTMIPSARRSGTGDAGRRQRLPRLLEQLPGAADLVDRGHHRQQQTHRVVGAHPQHGAKLADQQLRMAQAQTDPTEPQEGIVLVGGRQAGELFVGADVERAHDERATAETFGHRAVDQLLLVLVGETIARQEEELGAQQPDAVGAGGQGGGDVARCGHVGRYVDDQPIAGHGGQMVPSNT